MRDKNLGILLSPFPGKHLKKIKFLAIIQRVIFLNIRNKKQGI